MRHKPELFERNARILELRSAGYNRKQIAELTGIKLSTVCGVVQAAIRKGQVARQSRHKYSDKNDQIIALWNKGGLTKQQIAVATGTTHSYVENLLQQAKRDGLPVRKHQTKLSSLLAESNPVERQKEYQRVWKRQRRANFTNEERASALAYMREWGKKAYKRRCAEESEEERQKRLKRHADNEVKRREKIRREREAAGLPLKTEEEKQKFRQYYKLRRQKRLRENPAQLKIAESLSACLRIALKKRQLTKGCRTQQLLGCSIQEFMAHLEKEFYDDITWDNYGDHWEIDHIKPIASFDLQDPEQLKKCFHYTNMWPLRTRHNRIKSARLTGWARLIVEDMKRESEHARRR